MAVAKVGSKVRQFHGAPGALERPGKEDWEAFSSCPEAIGIGSLVANPE